jgi:putative aldouronate transport system substrate-binding protein
MAGGDYPDIMHIFHAINGAGVPELPTFIARECADLSPYLTGDAIKDYPNLAAIPTPIWKNSISVLEGKLYSWPIGRPLAFYGLYRDDDVWAKAAGQADYVPKDLDDFRRLLRVINDPRGGKWALGGVPGEPQQAFGAYSFSSIFGAPNNWRSDTSGKLIKDREAEEFKATVGFLRDAWAEGLFWPDGLSAANTRTGLPAGTFAMSWEGFGNSWVSLRRAGLALNPPRKIGWMRPFRATAGDKPQVFLGAGVTATNVMKKATPDRIRELLRIVDWLAAPFGSQEYVLLNYGIPGQDHTVDDGGNPVPTRAGVANSSNVPWGYLSRGPFVHYAPDIPGHAKEAVAIEKVHMDFGVFDPTFGFYSASDAGSAGLGAGKTFDDGLTSIIVGREPLSSYDQLLKDWQRAAGDKIRKEYQDAIAADK